MAAGSYPSPTFQALTVNANGSFGTLNVSGSATFGAVAGTTGAFSTSVTAPGLVTTGDGPDGVLSTRHQFGAANVNTSVGTAQGAASATIVVTSASGLSTGMYLFGTNVAFPTRILNINGTTLTLSQATSAALPAGQALTLNAVGYDVGLRWDGGSLYLMRTQKGLGNSWDGARPFMWDANADVLSFGGAGETSVFGGPTSMNGQLTLAPFSVGGIRIPNGSSTTVLFDDGNGHLESTQTMWINGNSAGSVIIAAGGGSTVIGSPSATTNLKGTVNLANALAPSSGGTGATSLSGALDAAFGATQGAVLYRGSGFWTALGPGAAGQVLGSGGTGANPSWVTPAGGTTATQVANTVLAGPTSGSAAAPAYRGLVAADIPSTLNAPALGAATATTPAAGDSSAKLETTAFSALNALRGDLAQSLTAAVLGQMLLNIGATGSISSSGSIRIPISGGALFLIYGIASVSGDATVTMANSFPNNNFGGLAVSVSTFSANQSGQPVFVANLDPGYFAKSSFVIRPYQIGASGAGSLSYTTKFFYLMLGN